MTAQSTKTPLVCFLRQGLPPLLLLTAMVAGCQQRAGSDPEPSEGDAADSPRTAPASQSNAPATHPPTTQADTAPPTAQEGKAARHPANRLAKETSPYLLLHAHNPVDWYPWGEEAFEKARRENKLIFLSIGYSSCYWCHVMERESFMDEEIAAFMNEHFVAIKVDREERPDIDEIYMTALQAMNRRGGWPLSMFLTPDAEPIVGGTYYPPRAKRGFSRGFLDLLKLVHAAWSKNPDDLSKQGQDLAGHLRSYLEQRPVATVEPSEKILDAVLKSLASQFDPEHGGFGFVPVQPQRPKFPQPPNLVFLVGHADRHADDEPSRKMLLSTLEKMAQGGIRDHLGGGFHRYSTDRFWRIPHFEKMLYDNGQLASVYAEAYAQSGREDFRRVVDQLAEFVLREMTDEGGAFYSALDAETDAEEGKVYVWTTDELQALLDDDEFALLADVYGVGEQPNFERHHVLLLDEPLAATAAERGVTEAALEAQLLPIRQKLFAHRAQRERPLTDTKILTAWNGLMIAGLADAGRIFTDERYTRAAAKAADFILANLRTPDGRLLRTYSAGEAKLNAYLDDYAFLVHSLIALHRATGEAKWLEAADQLTAKQIGLFWDERAGGFFFTSHDHETLLARSKDPVDGAIPAGNSVAAHNLLSLADALERPEYLRRAEKTIRAGLPLLDSSPSAAPLMAAALARYLDATAAAAEKQ